MVYLLKLEWLKIKKYIPFYIILAAFILGLGLVNYIVGKSTVEINSQNPLMVGQKFNPYDFKHTWHTTSYVSGWLLMLPAMLLLLLFTNEYGYRTVRQNVIDGLAKKQFINAKLLLAILFALGSTILIFLTALIFGLFSKTAFDSYEMYYLGYVFLKAFTYNVFAMLIAVLIRKTGFAIAVFFMYIATENLISQLLDVWSGHIKKTQHKDLGFLGDYLPLNAADGLLTFPDNPLKGLVSQGLPEHKTTLCLCLAIFYIILILWWTYSKYRKTDL